MAKLDRNGYSADQVDKALHAARAMSFRYELYDKDGKYKAALSNVLGAAVEYNALADIKRTAKFDMEDSSAISFGTDRIRPWARLRMPDGGYAEFSLGVLMLSTAPRQTDGSGKVTRSVEAYDLAQILVDDCVTERYTAPASADPIELVRTLLTGAGITAMNLTTTTKRLPAARDWKMGTSKLDIINDLLSIINYDSLYFDADGVAVARPYVSPDQRASEYTYADDSLSVMFPDAEQGADTWGVPNKWVLVVSESDTDVWRSEYTNSNPLSPTSTVSLGRTIVKTDTVDADSQASLDDMVRRKAFEDSQVYETVQMGTAIMPFHGHRDVITLRYTDPMGISANFEEVMWGFELRAEARMKHVLRRIVPV